MVQLKRYCETHSWVLSTAEHMLMHSHEVCCIFHKPYQIPMVRLRKHVHRCAHTQSQRGNIVSLICRVTRGCCFSRDKELWNLTGEGWNICGQGFLAYREKLCGWCYILYLVKLSWVLRSYFPWKCRKQKQKHILNMKCCKSVIWSARFSNTV